jgi:uncharacterized membrane protein
MRKLALLALALGLSCAGPAWGKFTGLSLSTPYPDQTVQAGETTVIPLTVHNYGLGPQVVSLEVLRVAKAWQARFEGDARRVGAVFVGPGADRPVSLHLTPPKDVASGTFEFELRAQGDGHAAELPVTLHLAKTLPDWLSLTADLPTLKGTASTDFSYDVKIHNRSGRDVMVNLSASAPAGSQVDFSPEFGSQEVTALPVKAGSTKSISAKVTLPAHTNAGSYRFEVVAAAAGARAELPLTLVVSGSPQLTLSTPTGLLSGDASVGRATTVALVVHNGGSAPAHDIGLSADSPSHWQVRFDPKEIATLAPHRTTKVSAILTPSSRSLAGDYMVTFDADGNNAAASADYRVTVMTSTLWGVVGIALAAAAVLVIGFAVMRFGRR